MRTIKGKIFIRFLVVIGAFFVVVATAATYLTAQLTHEFAVRDSQNSLEFLVSNIRSSYFSHLIALDEVAAKEEFRAGDLKKSMKTVEAFLDFNRLFSTVHYYHTNGDLLFVKRKEEILPYKAEPSFKYKSPKFLRLVNEVIESGESRATPTFYTKSNYLYQLYLVPVKDSQGKVIGILSGGVFPRFHNLNYLLEGLAMAPHNFIYISDDRGSTLAASGAVPKRLPEIGVYEVRECEAKVEPNSEDVSAVAALFSGSNDDPYIQMSKQVPDLKLKVTLGLNRGLIQAKVSEILQNLFLAFIVCFLAALALSIYLGNKMSKPLQEMLETTREMDRGNLDVALDSTKQDEFGELAKYIDRIRKKIRKDRLLGEIWGEELRP